MRGLVVGFGNPGRGDDGIGVRLAEALESGSLEGVEVEAAFQPGLEHAASVAEHDWVLFVDAAVEGPAPFSIKRLEPSPNIRFSTHVVDLGSILAVAADSFGSRTPAWLLAVRGYDFEMSEQLSERAAGNLEAALAYARDLVGQLQKGKGERSEQHDQSHRTDHR